MTLRVIDISNYQPDHIDPVAIAGAGVSGVAVKATEGVGYTSPTFHDQISVVDDSNLASIAYHFCRPDLGNSPEAEAEWFVSQAHAPKRGYMADMEVGGGNLDPWLSSFCARVSSLTGRSAILPYSDEAFFEAHLTSTAISPNAWKAAYGSIPKAPFLLWQYTNHRWTPGVGYTDESWFYGNLDDLHALCGGTNPMPGLAAPIVGVAMSADGQGYYEVGADGGIFCYGDAQFHGSVPGLVASGQVHQINAPVVGIAVHPDDGYWLAAGDGGIFAFGAAAYEGGMGGQQLVKPIVGIASSPSGKGYVLVAADGGTFAYGDVSFVGRPAATAPQDAPAQPQVIDFNDQGHECHVAIIPGS